MIDNVLFNVCSLQIILVSSIYNMGKDKFVSKIMYFQTFWRKLFIYKECVLDITEIHEYKRCL